MSHILKGTSSDATDHEETETLVRENGNALFHSIVSVPETFKMISQSFLLRLPKNSDVIFSTDLYKKASTKQKERQHRGQGPMYRIQGQTKRPDDWKLFLSNSSNKLRLAKILKETWKSDECAPNFHERTVTIICEGGTPETAKAFQFSSSDGNKPRLKTLLSLHQPRRKQTPGWYFMLCFF